VNLEDSGATVTLSRSSLTVRDTKNGDCTPRHGEWTMTNTTSTTQVVELKIGPPLRLKPSDGVAFCGFGGPGTYVMKFTLKADPHAKLKVTTIIP
jgi:hypothetical protein